ncbi:MAG TPA: nicotinate phosphoribosyltransferase [Nitrososphaeraceae archaeon]|nr:nicotinate phosphoribosyltransferase [Nitrososphaeraceae archaeon]
MHNNSICGEIKNFALATDLYQIAMAAAYYSSPYHRERKTVGIFEMFVRELPKNRPYIIVAGLEQVIQYILNLCYDDEQIAYLQSLEVFKYVNKGFFDYLRRFKFSGSLWSVPEGTILFPNEPILRIEAPIIEAQLLETYVLSTVNFQSLIATKAARITSAADHKPVVEFGSRRAHGPQAGVLAARGAFIGGCVGTSNTLAGKAFGIPVFGTMAHSLILSYENELDAFREFNNIFPKGYLLVDTYDTLKAVTKLLKSGIKPYGVRLDSGDLYTLSVETRKLLDNAVCKDTKIMVSGDLNEHSISKLLASGAPIDSFGVGTELSTSRDSPVMNGVYKLVAVKVRNSSMEYGEYKTLYKSKTSVGKETYPGPKQVGRLIEDNVLERDYLMLENEKPPDKCILLLKKWLENGNSALGMPSIFEIQDYCSKQLELLPTALKSLDVEPVVFPVVISQKIGSLRHTA